MVIPEINPEHLEVIPFQKQRLGTKNGFIAVKSNCSIQSYVPALSPLREEFGLERVLACTYQAISGAGKTFGTWPEMVDNVIPYIGGEEEKSEREPMKVWGSVEGGMIRPAVKPLITAQCFRVAASNGHMAAVFASFTRKPPMDEIKARWAEFRGRPQELGLPSAPQQFLRYFDEPDRPQTRLEPHERGRHADIHRPPARGHAVRLQVRLPQPQHPARRRRRRRRAGRAAVRGGLHIPQIRLQ